MSPALLTLPPMPGKSADSGYGPSAATTTASLSKGSMLNDGVDSTTMNVVVRDVAGNPLAGVVPTARSSGSNNTIGTFSASDALGNSSATFKSTTAETKSIILNVGRDLDAAPLSLTVTSSSISVGGSVALDAGGASAGGGVVQALDGVSLSEIARATVNGSGNYSITGIASGSNVTLKYHPAHGFCLGASQADTTALGVISTNQTGKNFNERPAYFFDDLQSYADTTALKNTSTGLGAKSPLFGNTSSFAIPANTSGAIVLDPTGGPTGEKAMRYDFPDRSNAIVGNPTIKVDGALSAGATSLNIKGAKVGTVVYTGNFMQFSGETGTPNHTVTNGPYTVDGSGNVTGVTFTTAIAASGVADGAAVTMNFNYTLGFSSNTLSATRPLFPNGEVWLRMISKETLGFQVGDMGLQTSVAYKFLRLFVQRGSPTVFNPDIDFGTDPSGNGTTTGSTSVPWITFMDDPTNGNHLNSTSFNLGSLAQTFDGQYHTWVWHITGIGSSGCTLAVYRDGVLLFTGGPFLMDSPDHVNKLDSVAWGSVINSGPAQAQSRWFRELGIYFYRPSLLNGVG